jgi:hypothetical protein
LTPANTAGGTGQAGGVRPAVQPGAREIVHTDGQQWQKAGWAWDAWAIDNECRHFVWQMAQKYNVRPAVTNYHAWTTRSTAFLWHTYTCWGKVWSTVPA